ncbi:hypothetical protein BT63DRAFT_327557 [Microthyrium microscopicum]|uniref:Protection of telomeres protein 1 ssDNA-binding domain-containing protein n=1 Tax=Microthyrium microscopicum TaxID=703497 RepID=A0A6A6U446_9PEZI|nr:hypothetical protein BT63DRAFT_327557 [Microthyrium microscopicum]
MTDFLVPPLPHGFTHLVDIASSSNTKYDVVGVICDHLPPKELETKDWMIKVVLQSPDGHQFPLRLFYRNREDVDTITGIGNIVFVWSASKRTTRDREQELVANRINTLVVIQNNDLPDVEFAGTHITNPKFKYTKIPDRSTRKLTDLEQLYALHLSSWKRKETFASQAQTTNNSPVELSSLRVDRFYNVVGEVVKTWWESGASSVYSLYITDYTENPFFFDQGLIDSGSQSHNNLISGKRTVQVSLFSPHADWATHNISVGDFVWIRNLLVRHRNNSESIIEGKLHTDTDRPNQIDIFKLQEGDLRLLKLLKARKEYHELPPSPSEDLDKQSKNAKKKRDKKKRKEAERERLEQEELERQNQAPKPQQQTTAPIANPLVVPGFPLEILTDVVSIIEAPELQGTNPRTGKPITFPFVNKSYRAQVRVLDFKPDLEDFCQSLDDPEYNDIPMDTSATWNFTQCENRWEWAFYLLVEDAHPNLGQPREKLMLIVNNKNAQFLLNLDACDLRKNPETLKELREKLFALWGEIEESKRNGTHDLAITPRNRPFICCIQEYGVKNNEGGWNRMHAMTSTTIRK